MSKSAKKRGVNSKGEQLSKLGMTDEKVKNIKEPTYGLKITAEEKKIEQLEKEKADFEGPYQACGRPIGPVYYSLSWSKG
jgi:hypothetical protein